MSRRFVITRIGIKGKMPLVCAIFEDHRMLEVQCIPEDAPPQILNNIYVGRVSQVVKNIGAAFVEIEKGRKCFLPLSDLKEPVYVKRMSEKQPLSQGDELLVQIVREAVKTKDPQVSTNLSLAGIYSVVTSGTHQLGVSAKLDPVRREALRKLAESVYDERFGVIVRTNAADLEGDDADILTFEIQSLQEQMQTIVSRAPFRTIYSVLYEAPPEYIRILQNQPLEPLAEVVTDDADIYKELTAFSDTHPSMKLSEKLRFYKDKQLDLHKLYAIEVQLERALQKKIWLKSGANLLIEPTEAMTVIDVNSSKNIKKKLPEEQHLQVNLEAAAEIAAQLRLRNLSGIIIIDFIDMASAEHKECLLSAMQSFVKTDPVKTEVVDLTRLGLMELTRKKTRRPLREQLGMFDTDEQ
ncbi:MAG: ribonuclease E/G [Lachnospiraceae bacterium]|nr:ribonuclease E/G [Lachnospiraceae bacterium]